MKNNTHMPEKMIQHSPVKSKLHPRNKHRKQYDFKQLIKSNEKLSNFVKFNDYGNKTIDFFNPDAVVNLNTALLKHFYNIKEWSIPEGYLCPPVPGRADYIHYVADLLSNNGKIPTGNNIKCLDIGVGASCIYPIIGNREYGWSFVGSDIDVVSINSSNAIINTNPGLKENIEIRLQENAKNIFKGIIKKDDFFYVVICNPPFHSSQKEANKGTIRKLRNLKNKKHVKSILNFGGQSNELWCEGGEEKFIKIMIRESKQFSKSCFWFTTLVSKKEKLKNIYSELNKMDVAHIKTINMGQGNKISRIVAWTFKQLRS